MYVRTPRGVIPRRVLNPNAPYSSDMLPCDTGSRIGMIYVQTPSDENKAEMHFIVNGEDQGPCAKDIPYKDSELYAVIDVYGTTKQVKIIQLYESKCIEQCGVRMKLICCFAFQLYRCKAYVAIWFYHLSTGILCIISLCPLKLKITCWTIKWSRRVSRRWHCFKQQQFFLSLPLRK